MRIISQNGEINLPYEMTAILVSENHIQAVFSGDARKIPYLMAGYSSKKNCVDVMSMLNDGQQTIAYSNKNDRRMLMEFDILTQKIRRAVGWEN